MSLLLLDRAHLEARTEGDTLVLYEAGARRGTVPIQLIERCVVHGAQTTLTSGVLLKLAEAGVNTVFMSPSTAGCACKPATSPANCATKAWPGYSPKTKTKPPTPEALAPTTPWHTMKRTTGSLAMTSVSVW